MVGSVDAVGVAQHPAQLEYYHNCVVVGATAVVDVEQQIYGVRNERHRAGHVEAEGHQCMAKRTLCSSGRVTFAAQARFKSPPMAPVNLWRYKDRGTIGIRLLASRLTLVAECPLALRGNSAQARQGN